MSKINIPEKVERVSKLLWGLRHPDVAAALLPFGLKNEVLNEGWDTVEKVNALYFTRVASRPAGSDAAEIVGKVNAFEDRWLPVVKGALSRSYPEVSELLFLNITRARGQSAAHGVQTFVDRLRALEKGEAPFGEKGPEVREYLRGRGLVDSVILEVVAELEGRRVVSEGTASEPFDDAALEKAVAEMWAFYLEWSAIVRACITDGRLLRTLGFKKRAGGRTPKAAAVVITSERHLDGSAPVPQLPGE
jgi:hypothetical protein